MKVILWAGSWVAGASGGLRDSYQVDSAWSRRIYR